MPLSLHEGSIRAAFVQHFAGLFCSILEIYMSFRPGKLSASLNVRSKAPDNPDWGAAGITDCSVYRLSVCMTASL